MIHLPDLIQDLGFILITAAAVTLVFKKLKQPIVLGYLIAGLLLSPHVDFLPNVRDINSIQVWAEIGVIFLLFGLGLEFSFKKLAKVGKPASMTAVFEVAFMWFAGFFAGQIMGWSRMDSVFLGGIISVSSTTIIVRAFDELGLKGRPFVSLVFGVLIVEDIVAVLLLVLLSTVAISQTLSGSELALSSLRLGFFLVLWFIVGIYLLPPLLNRVRNLLNAETMLVVSLGLCLLMVIIAVKLGFSAALGAFVMGSLLAETNESERIEKLIHPVRDLFGAVFFVSVGMMIDPKILIQYGPEVLAITVLIILGKFISASLGALISGVSLRQSVRAGMSLAQIGEFSFIIATLGLTLKVTSDFLYPIAVAASVITAFTAPYFIKFSDSFVVWLEKNIPIPVLARLERYRQAVQSESGYSGIARLLWHAYGLRIGINSILVIAIFLFVDKILTAYVSGSEWSMAALAATATFLSVPFFWAISFGGRSTGLSLEDRIRVNRLSLGILITRGFFAVLLAGSVINLITPIESLAGGVIFWLLVVSVVAGRFSESVYGRLENRFLKNLESGDSSLKHHIPTLAPWDAGLADFNVHPNSSLVGLSLQNSKLKENFGVTVALVERGEERYLAPDRNFVLMPNDQFFIIGSEDQLLKAKAALENPRAGLRENQLSDSFGLRSILLTDQSPFAGHILRESGLREAILGLVVGVERAGRRILSPDSSMVLTPGDLLWVVGDLERIKNIRTQEKLEKKEALRTEGL